MEATSTPQPPPINQSDHSTVEEVPYMDKYGEQEGHGDNNGHNNECNNMPDPNAMPQFGPQNQANNGNNDGNNHANNHAQHNPLFNGYQQNQGHHFGYIPQGGNVPNLKPSLINLLGQSQFGGH